MKADEKHEATLAELTSKWKRAGLRIEQQDMQIAELGNDLMGAHLQIARMRFALQKIADTEPCSCGVPCDCVSWKVLVHVAREALRVFTSA